MKNVFLLPTDKPSRLFENVDCGLSLNDELEPNGIMCQNQNIYITSSEEIKEGDVCINLAHRLIVYPTDAEWANSNHNNLKKIILTTDQDLIKDGVQAIDDEFLEWFVKNPSCKWVEIDKRELNTDYRSDWKQKFNYKIIIPKEETKLKNICIKCGVDLYATEGRFECQKHPKECKGIYLSEETLLIHAAEKKQQVMIDQELHKAAEKATDVDGLDWENVYARNKFIEGAKWQMERSYSEEEVYDLIHKRDVFWTRYKNTYSQDYISTKDWFEQFKKK